MDVNSISTLSGAKSYLKSVSSAEEIVEEIIDIIYSWSYKSEFNLEAIRNDLNGIIAEVMLQQFNDKRNDDILKAVTCIVYNEVYENLTPLIRGNFSKEDLFLYEKCQHFCKRNVTPGEFGSSTYNSLPFTAAIVELSVLDNYKSPLEKLNCLCYTYDLIFADLKLALASLISKYSKKEFEIPIINNDEIIPILTVVVIKSKLLYLPSNLFYIQYFGEDIIQQNSGIRNILQAFETVINNLMKSEGSYIDHVREKLAPHLDIHQAMEIMAAVEKVKENESNSENLDDEEKKRIVTLISTSTTEKDFIPLDLPKIFS